MEFTLAGIVQEAMQLAPIQEDGAPLQMSLVIKSLVRMLREEKGNWNDAIGLLSSTVEEVAANKVKHLFMLIMEMSEYCAFLISSLKKHGITKVVPFGPTKFWK